MIAVFSPPRTLDQLGLFAWLTAFGLLARISISFYTVPALALGAELSRDPAERAVIAMLRNVGNNIAVLLVPFLAFQLFFVPTPEFPKGQLNPAPYTAFGLTTSLLAAAAMIVAIVGTRARLRALEQMEKPKPAETSDAGVFATLRALLLAVRVTPNLRRLIALIFIVLVTLATVNQLTLHLSTYLWRLSADQNQIVLVAGAIGSLTGVIAAVRVVRLLEHRAVMIFGLIGFLLFALVTIALPLLGLGASPESEGMGWFVSGCRFLGGVLYGIYLVPLGALIMDISDEHEANTGRPQQGLVSAVHFLGLQAASAVVGLVSGVFLDLVSFPVGLPVNRMPADKIESLGLFVITIIAIAGVLLIGIVRGFEISRERQALISRRLIALRTGAIAQETSSSVSGAQPAPQ